MTVDRSVTLRSTLTVTAPPAWAPTCRVGDMTVDRSGTLRSTLA